MQTGDPLSPDCRLGPLVSQGQYDKVLGYIEAGRAEGATLLTGGRRPPSQAKGFFVEPTVFVGVQPHMRIWREEIFGPVLAGEGGWLGGWVGGGGRRSEQLGRAMRAWSFKVPSACFACLPTDSIFCPLVCPAPHVAARTFRSEAEAVELANSSEFGLGAGVISADPERCR